MMLSPEDITRCFTRDDGSYAFARWGRPIAPVVFGVEDETLGVIKSALQAVAQLGRIEIAETDPELGANLMVFFFRDWAELMQVPDLDRLIPELGPRVARLEAAEALQYRAFRFDEAGAIQASFVFLRMRGAMAELDAETLALTQAVSLMLLWSERAFSARAPLATLEDGRVVVKPEIAALIRAAYDPVLPAAAQDPSHALRLAARLALDPGV
ncbi:hypothetical protein SAMN04515673_10814 [Poseidonocella sedimentorum]|uniref:Uncharacterized protein n=2 Tax=Poseidonocella sedimentorum TaxID=871652 RepID=A0A1I6E7L4_9RHOB|nr:hypothetical protein SAMN04515673_10814 [Poseidonocella sedimentorum]